MSKEKTLIIKHVPPSIHRRLKVESAKTDKSIQLIVLELIKKYFNKQK